MNRRQEREYDIFLSPADFIRVRSTKERGRILVFTVQYELAVEGIFRPAERYDTAHGFVHRDTLAWDGLSIRKTPLLVEMDFNEAFTYAIDDIKANWPVYRDAFLRRKPR